MVCDLNETDWLNYLHISISENITSNSHTEISLLATSDFRRQSSMVKKVNLEGTMGHRDVFCVKNALKYKPILDQGGKSSFSIELWKLRRDRYRNHAGK